MCFSCNPFCGNCKPPMMVSVMCPKCGSAAVISRERYLLLRGLKFRMSEADKELANTEESRFLFCGKCGEDISGILGERVKPKPCFRSGIICGYPCGRSVDEPKKGEPMCEKMVPLGKLSTNT